MNILFNTLEKFVEQVFNLYATQTVKYKYTFFSFKPIATGNNKQKSCHCNEEKKIPVI